MFIIVFATECEFFELPEENIKTMKRREGMLLNEEIENEMLPTL